MDRIPTHMSDHLTGSLPKLKPIGQLEPEFQDSYSAWKSSPDPRTTGALLQQLDPVIASAVKNYGLGSSGPTIKGKARRIIVQALPGYDPASGKLKGYLNSHLQGLRRHATRQTTAIGIPEQILLDQQHLFESSEQLRDDLNREPSDVELADRSGLSLKRIKHIRTARPGLMEGQVRAPGEDGSMERLDTVAKVPGQSDPGEDAWLQFVYHSADSKDQIILEHVLGMNGRPVLPANKIAKKLRMTPAAVSQRAAKLQQQLNERERIGVL